MQGTFNAPAFHERFKDVAELREFGRWIIAQWDRDRDRVITIRSEYAEVAGPYIWSHAHHVVELTRTVLELSEQDRILTAVPLIRLSTESAITAVWLVLRPDGGRALLHEGLRKRKAAFKNLAEIGSEVYSDDKLADIDVNMAVLEGSKSPAAGSFEQMCREIVDGLGVYTSWRAMSTLSHAGMALGDFYLEEDASAPTGIAFAPDAQLDNHEAWVGTGVCNLLVALKAFDQIDADGRRKRQVAKAAKKIGISLDFRLVADGAVE